MACAQATREKSGPFPFAESALPWPLEHVVISAPGESERREPQGDWLSLFRNAAPYIACYQRGTVVVHVDAPLTDDANEREAFKGLMQDVAFCSLLGLRVVLVICVEGRLTRRLKETGLDCQRNFLGKDIGVSGNELEGVIIDEQIMKIAKQ
ncbi:unnamed protein product, partial [Prorocentrum cordatum]